MNIIGNLFQPNYSHNNLHLLSRTIGDTYAINHL